MPSKIKKNKNAFKPLERAMAYRLLKREVEEKPKEKIPWVEFAKKCQIRSGRSLIPFEPYEWQTTFLEQLEKHRGIVLCKSRQMGATEFIGNWLLWNAVDDPAFVAVIFSKTQTDSSIIANRVKLMLATYPELEFETNNTKDLKLKNGGQLIFKASTPNAARGIPSVAVLVFDESAFVPEIEVIHASAQPATAMLGDKAKTILMSTPNGQQGFFWELLEGQNKDLDVLRVCREIRNQEKEPISYWTDNDGWCKFFVHWRAHPIYGADPYYLEGVKNSQKLTDAQIEREYNLNFEEAVNAIYPIELINRAARGYYQPPMAGRKYIGGVDPSFGGDDYFVLTIWDVTTTPYNLVHIYREHNKAKDYNLAQVVSVVNRYKPAVLGVESNSGGRLILEDLIKNLPWCKIEAVQTTAASKIVSTDRILLLLERDQIIYPDGDMRIELSAFREILSGTRRKREAITGHDDIVMSTAIAFTVFNVPLFEMSVGVVRY